MLDTVALLLVSEFDVVGTVTNGKALLSAAERLKPDVMIVDISMPILNGIEISTMIMQDMVTSLASGRQPSEASAKLTTRQREVLQLLAEGHSMKEAANILDLSPRTIAFHKYRIMEEVGLKTNADLVQFAIKHGVVSL